MPSGQDLKTAIRTKGLTMDQAAKAIGMTRANLYSYLNRAELEKAFVLNVNTKLDINLGDGNGQKDDFQALYIAQLKENLELSKLIISMAADIKSMSADVKSLMNVRELAESNNASLIQVEENLDSLLDWNEALKLTVADHLTDSPKKARDFLSRTGTFFSEIRTGARKRDKRVNTGT